jgi:hypothetical protein
MYNLRSSSKGSSPLPRSPRTSSPRTDNLDLLGRRIAKYFGDTEVYYGTIDRISIYSRTEPWYWHVQYDDDDQEEFEEAEIDEHLRLYEELKSGDQQTACKDDENDADEDDDDTGVDDADTDVDDANEHFFKKRRLYLDSDEEVLSKYQCLLRKQIELFEAGPDDVRGHVQGRNTPIHLGQVGIRCRHCVPFVKNTRASGAVYYSKTLGGIYQVAQNMSKLHLQKTCNLLDANTRTELAKLGQLSQLKNRASGSGPKYWSGCLREMGLYEKKGCLRFQNNLG